MNYVTKDELIKRLDDPKYSKHFTDRERLEILMLSSKCEVEKIKDELLETQKNIDQWRIGYGSSYIDILLNGYSPISLYGKIDSIISK